MKKRQVPINYLDRDFNSIKSSLVEYAKRYYPNTHKDFNEASFGSLMTDMVSYVGDVLSFYTDYQANEAIMITSQEYNNVIKHGRPLGYKFRGNPSAHGIGTFYIVVPRKSVGLGPDPDYIPKLLRGSEFATTEGTGFILNEDVDFANSNNEVVVAEVDQSTGAPLSYAIKAYGRVISGAIVEEILEVGEFQRFLRIELAGANITEVLRVEDTEGHEYFEVENLSQNIIFTPIPNRGFDKEDVSSILKPVIVPRRFVVEQERDNTYLQFGFGTEDEIRERDVADPANVILNIHGRNHISDTSFDPSRLLESDKFGVAPANTTIRVVYRNNTDESVNAAQDTMIEVVDPIFEFTNITTLDDTRVSSIINSLETTNDEPIIGDVSLPNVDELKRRMLDKFATQDRAVSTKDYASMVYNMPPQFGAVKRVSVIRDPGSPRRNLNMCVISENQGGTLTATTATIKSNLKTWIRHNKMINDTIDIIDAKIVNLGIQFDIIAEEDANRFAVLQAATTALAADFSLVQDIGEPFDITRMYKILNDVDGIVDTVRVRVSQKIGGAYSDIRFNIDEMMSADGRLIYAPKNVIFEVKFPNVDIVGNIR